MKKKKLKQVPISPKHITIGIGGLVLLILLIIGISNLVSTLTSNQERMDLNSYYKLSKDNEVAIILNDKVLEAHASIIDEQIYIDYQTVHDHINPRFYWDANENILLYTSAENVYSAHAEATSYFIGKSSKDFGNVIVKSTADSALIHIDYLKLFSNFIYDQYDTPSRIVMRNDWKDIQVTLAKKNTLLRYEGDKSSAILSDIKKGTLLNVLEQDKTWTKVCTSDGLVGFIATKHTKDTHTQTLSYNFEEDEFFHILKNKPVNLLWHNVEGSNDNSEISQVLTTTKGVNVVAPSWFELKDNKGNISNLASRDYVEYCHNHNVEVWGQISNNRENVNTSRVLTHTSSRQNLVNQLVAAALQYNFDGINIDFTDLDESKIGDGYIQFIRELSIKCENNDVSLSVNIPSATATSDFHHYSEQQLFVDYIIIKAYGEHTGQETGEGSYASLNWVEELVSSIKSKGIPSEQLILGIPLTCKLWTLSPTSDSDADTQYLISSETKGINSSKRWMDSNIDEPVWLEDCGQWYGETTIQGTIYKLWVEDAASIEKKLLLMQEKELAGAAFSDYDWSVEEIWNTIIKYVN